MKFALFFLLLLPAWANALLLDDLLHTQSEQAAFVRLSYDFMNQRYDIFHLEKHDIKTDYQGFHINAGYAPIERLSFDASYWKRQIHVASLDAHVSSWQFAAQYQFYQSRTIALAVRAGFGQNTSDDDVAHRYNLLQGGSTQTADVAIKSPYDKRLQVDFIADFYLNNQLSLSSYLSLGKSTIDFKDYQITGTHGGCLYNLYFTDTGYHGHLAQACDADAVITDFTSPYDANDVRIDKELRYDAHYYQTGLALKWQQQQWTLRAAYRLIYLDRGQLDDILHSRHKTSYNTNQILTGQVSYSPISALSLIFTAQYFHHQLNGEIPFIYNSVSAKYFNRHYGLLSLGLQWQWP